MLVLQATGDIRKVALWLGHDDIQTTEVYLRADPSLPDTFLSYYEMVV
jgi:site-specific recombinase XerC